MKFVSVNTIQTKKIAARLARKILKSNPHRKHARVIALVGELGSGKTTFVQGFAKALGIKHRIVSPTFLIFRNYPIGPSLRALAKQSYKYFYHVDVYRIQKTKEMDVLDFKDILKDRHNILVIEWAEKIKKMLPKDAIWVRFEHGKKENERTVSLRGA